MFLQILLLLCGDVAMCPGPIKVKCATCLKSVKSSQSRVSCSTCEGIIHVKCLFQDDNEALCQRCLLVNANSVKDQTVNHAECESAGELLSRKGLKILHQNI